MDTITTRRIGIAFLALALWGCGDGEGNLSVLLESEDTVAQGLNPGTAVANIRDGWQVRHQKYLLAVGDLNLYLAKDYHVTASAPEVYVVDLTQIPAAGVVLWQLDDLRASRWNFHYATPAATADAERHPSVAQTDFDHMVADGLTYLIEGTLTQSGGRSCPPTRLATPPASAVQDGQNAAGDPCYPNPSIAFVIDAVVDTDYGPCEADHVPGVSVPNGGTQTVAISIHGDHIFFNGFTEGHEGGVQRLAQWLADCDLDLDGVVTRDELERIAIADLAEIDSRYQLTGGPPDIELNTMWDYVRAQLKTQGHYQGEGDCAVDGDLDHSHGHGHSH